MAEVVAWQSGRPSEGYEQDLQDQWSQAEWQEWERQEEQRKRAEMPSGSSPSTESIVTSVSYNISLRSQFLCMEPGRLFFSDIPRGIDPRLLEMLQPIFSHINRDDHSERAAFLHLSRLLLKRCGWSGTDDCSGWLRIYVSHFPCISCVAVTCQFVRFFPAIRLEMDFDNMWKTRFEPADKLGSDRFHREGGLAGRRKRIEEGFFEW